MVHLFDFIITADLLGTMTRYYVFCNISFAKAVLVRHDSLLHFVYRREKSDHAAAATTRRSNSLVFSNFCLCVRVLVTKNCLGLMTVKLQIAFYSAEWGVDIFFFSFLFCTCILQPIHKSRRIRP